MLSDVSESSHEVFELCFSVWELILSYCPEKEVEEVRRVLGASLIEQVCDLREEVSTLLEIWRGLKEDKATHPQPTRQLAEPPEMRQRLIQEIIFFVEYLKKKSKRNFAEQDENKDILHYVEREANRSGSGQGSRDSESGSCVSVGSGSRTHSSVSSRDGRETPLRPLTPKSQDESQMSLLTKEANRVNAMDIDSVIDHLRQSVKDECEQHQRDVEFLQCCLEEEQDDGMPAEPTLRELRYFGTQLERAVLEESQPAPSPTLPARPTLPPLPTIHPRPPTTVHCDTHSFSRASQVKRRDTKQSTRQLNKAQRATKGTHTENSTREHASFDQTCTCTNDTQFTAKRDLSNGFQHIHRHTTGSPAHSTPNHRCLLHLHTADQST